MRRWYALLLGDDGMARLVKDREGTTVLAEAPFPLELDRPYRLALTVRGNTIAGDVDGQRLVEAVDDDQPLLAGGVGLVVTEGTIAVGPVTVKAVE